MQLTTSPEKLSSILESAMLPSHSKALINPIILTSTEDQISTQGTYSDIIAYSHTFSKAFFEEYIPGEETPIPSPVLDTLRTSFKDEKVTLNCKTKLTLKDKREKYERDLETIPEKSFPIQFKKTDQGYTDSRIEPTTSFLVNIAELNLPPADKYTFTFAKNKLSVEVEKEGGKLTRKIPLKDVFKDTDISISVDATYFALLTKNLSNDVYMVLNENLISLSETAEDYTKAYLLSVLT